MSYVNQIQDKEGTLHDVQDKRIPVVSTSDNGKVLGVANDELAFLDINTIPTLTNDNYIEILNTKPKFVRSGFSGLGNNVILRLSKMTDDSATYTWQSAEEPVIYEVHIDKSYGIEIFDNVYATQDYVDEEIAASGGTKLYRHYIKLNDYTDADASITYERNIILITNFSDQITTVNKIYDCIISNTSPGGSFHMFGKCMYVVKNTYRRLQMEVEYINSGPLYIEGRVTYANELTSSFGSLAFGSNISTMYTWNSPSLVTSDTVTPL